MRTEEGQQKAAAICKKYGIDGLVVIGGDGSFAGAQKLANLGVNTIGIPGRSILILTCTDYTIGFDTAVNTAMEAIDKVRDTSTSHERCSIIEVMGRDAGYLALWCGIANGAERILMPEEHDFDEQEIIDDILKNKKRGKKNYIIINAEGIGDSINMAKRIEAATGIETRATILGHMQRGGSPTCKDRVYASIMGSMAVDLLCQGKTNRVVGYKNGEYVDYDIEEALAMKKTVSEYQYEVTKHCTVRKNRHIFLKTCRINLYRLFARWRESCKWTAKKTAPVGVFDSGVGGLTVAREISRQLPNENIVYFGDTARVPYGSKSQDTIIRFSEQIIRFLKTKQVKAIVIACNTASALALDA